MASMKHSPPLAKTNPFAMAALRMRRPEMPHDATVRITCSRCGGFLEVACAKKDQDVMRSKMCELVSMREGVCGECREGNHAPNPVMKRPPISET